MCGKNLVNNFLKLLKPSGTTQLTLLVNKKSPIIKRLLLGYPKGT
jgi:hypothetical protein